MSRRNVAVRRITLLVLLSMSVAVKAQTEKALAEMRRGDDLRYEYRFEDACEAYESAMEMFVDSLMTVDDSLLRLDISDRLLMAENGLSMMDFVYIPRVVAKHKFSVEDFYLYYPLPEGNWRTVPYQLDSTVHAFAKAAYIPENMDPIYWSAADADGVRNLYKTEYQDTLWTVPALLNEHLTSTSDEIYPMLSPDGSKMFFSSDGLYGIGGFDIYVSEWDDEVNDWSEPVNMGFPYSSPADDFLYIDTEDGEYSVFASNRDCSKDSVWVYVLEYDDIPVRHLVDTPEELIEIAAMNLSDSYQSSENVEIDTDIPENMDTRRYMDKMAEVRMLNDSIAYALAGNESRLPALQDSLARATEQLHKIEMEFLFSGVVIDPDKLLQEADREIASQTVDYAFTRQNPGEPLALKMQEPEPAFDYSFKILDEGQFAEDNTLPEGLVYQIQMFSLGTKATLANLKGLSPVFETETSNGRYVYRVGVFRTYNDVLANLNSVKKAGFRSAFITAFNDGEEVPISKAKTIEAENRKPSLYEIRITTADLDMILAEGIRQQAPGKDISRVEKEDSTVVYVVGPFADHDKAEELAGFIRAMGERNTECIELPQY